MNIEDNEDTAVRGLLGTAFATAEPPLRDLASGSIARGDAARRRNRLLAGGGAALSVVAVIGVAAAVTGVTSPTAKPGSGVASPAATAGAGAGDAISEVARAQDLRMHLPALLQPLLPAGITVQALPADYGTNSRARFLLTGPSGTTTLDPSISSVPINRSQDRTLGCLQQGGCEVKPVAGGTVYINAQTYTAAEMIGSMSKSVLKPGTANTVVVKHAYLTFVPTDRSKPMFQIGEGTQVAPVPFVDKAPADYTAQGGAWPPNMNGGFKSASNASGILLSPDDFATMVASPGLDQVEHELAPDKPIAHDALAVIADLRSQVAAAGAEVLPAGLKLSLLTDRDASLSLDGPTGSNELTWQLTKQTDLSRSQVLDFCPPNVKCDKKPVPGGLLVTWTEWPTDSNLVKIGDTPSAYHYTLLPADTSKPALEVTLGTRNHMTGKQSTPQMTADQFLTLAAKPRVQDAIDKTAAVLNQIQ
ncbi:MAG: hypothetical protein JF587_04660 [Catenulisporales bacterium]|nr:hypothetical protein [Catenulisporales bacterium]